MAVDTEHSDQKFFPYDYKALVSVILSRLFFMKMPFRFCCIDILEIAFYIAKLGL